MVDFSSLSYSRSPTLPVAAQIPIIFSVLSLFYVFTYKIISLCRKKTGDEAFEREPNDAMPVHRSWGQTFEAYDGLDIITFRTVRLISCLVLVYLQLMKPTDLYNLFSDLVKVPVYLYGTVLACRSIFATKAFWRDFYSRQLSLLLLVDFVSYSYLNLWPLCTVKGRTYDRMTEWTFWPSTVILTIAAVIVPLFMPRTFRPKNKQSIAGVEESASFISRYTFSYISKTLFYAYKVPRISVEELPLISDMRSAENMSRKFKYLDPLIVGRKRNFLWGIARAFRKSYMHLFTLTMLASVTTFLGATGMKNLLIYVESGQYAYGIRPWVWIIVLAFGPLFSGMFFTHFMSVSTRQVTAVESVVTQLVFEHSLRIRMRVKEDKKPASTGIQTPKSDASSIASGSGTVSDNGTLASSSQSTIAVRADGEEAVAKNEATDDLDVETEAEEDEELLEEIEDNAHVVNGKPRMSDLIGKINSLVTTDLNDVTYLQNTLNLPAAIVQIAIALVFLYNILGWSALVGFATMALFIPFPAMLGKLLMKVNREKKALTDKRVQTVSESLGVLRMVKLFAWEPHIIEKLTVAREAEVKKLRRGRLLEAVNSGVSELIPLVTKTVVFAIYTLGMRKELTPSVMFSSLMVFRILEGRMRYAFVRIPEILRSLVTFQRYTEFFNSTELLPFATESLDLDSAQEAQASPNRDEIGFHNCSFAWVPFDSAPDKGRRRFRLTFGDNVIFQRGHINLILGPTASGKTSVLMALLGEMYYKPNGPDSWFSLPRENGIAYAAQESWVLNETVKANILFGQPFDEDRYSKVIKQCALEQDLSLWKAGDLTEVGEKGLTLSGGQKARVTLARALYSPASIVLLDDVLAALDVHTAKHIVTEALRGELVRGRTVLLVTHNIALTAPIAEHVLLLGKNGKVLKQGTVADVLKYNAKLRAQVVGLEAIETEETKEETKDEPARSQDKATAGKLVVAEEKAMGRMGLASIMLYLKSYGGATAWTITILLLAFTVLSETAQPWFVGIWSSQYEKHPASEVQVVWYFSVYVAIATIAVLFDFSRRSYTAFRTAVASEVIHYKLIDSVLRAPIRWLDVTPVGRILTRCTQDIGTIDVPFPMMFSMFIYATLYNLTLLIISIVQAGLYALVPGLILTVVGGYMSSVYLKAQVNVKREMNLRKAPVLSQLGVALAGLQSIRAYGAKQFFRLELNKRVDDYVRASMAFYDLNRWVSVRLDFLGAVFSCAVASYLVYGSTSPAGSVGFTMSIVLSFAETILYVVRIYNMVESNSNSLERILDYLRIEHEPAPSEGINPPAYWPASGELRVEGLSARYSDDSPEVLKKLTFEIKSGERVGVVGRTGAGKSTIALALLRAIKTSGKVYFDGLATGELSLHALRSKITLIPQQPELIQGTLRENLDPFGEHDDAFLNHALRASQLHDVNDLRIEGEQDNQGETSSAKSKARNSIGLDTAVEGGGANFSMGQRQIIALARAIVRKSKLLILDEATAAIDYATDTAIQKTLRTEFGKDTTMITIAHRLQTIMDYDKIMVLDAGELVEFDTPKNLLVKEGGVFSALVEESEDREILKAMVIS